MRTLFHNAQVLTLADEHPTADAFIVAGREVVAIGAEPQTRAKGFDQAVNLNGRCVIPGLAESHGHLFWTGLQVARLRLNDCRSMDEVIDAVLTEARRLPHGQWIVGDGWDENLWKRNQGIDHRRLSDAIPAHPVALTRVDGHALLVNALALARGNVSKDAGVLVDDAMEPILAAIPKPSREELAQALSHTLTKCAERGITSFHECGAGRDEMTVLQEFVSKRQLRCRIHAMVDGLRPGYREEWIERGIQELDETGFLQVRCMKLFADGALGSRGAHLWEPYSDDASSLGFCLASVSEIARLATLCLGRGFQVATHAIGDRANGEVLKAYGIALRHREASDHRFRIEHAQMLGAGEIAEMARLKVFASVQCSHCISDLPWALARLGEKRLSGLSYRWKSLLRAGIPLINGSDTPVETMSPFAGMQAAVTRRSAMGEDRSGGAPGEVLTPLEALRAMTRTAAEAAFLDPLIGSLEVGKRADFAVLSQNPLVCPAEKISSTEVLQTWVDGEKIFAS